MVIREENAMVLSVLVDLEDYKIGAMVGKGAFRYFPILLVYQIREHQFILKRFLIDR